MPNCANVMDPLPLRLSIITVVFNDREGIEKTVNSVLREMKNYENSEYIIIDGGSTDGTVDFIKEVSGSLSYWVSESDGGIYDAMNKGLEVAKGDIILFLNAGDYFVGNVLVPIHSYENPIFIPVKYFDFFGYYRSRKIINSARGLPNCHQGIIFKASRLRYDTKYLICSDYDYYLQHGYRNQYKEIRCSGYIHYDSNGVSSRKILEREAEMSQIRRKYFSPLLVFLYNATSSIKLIIRKMLLRGYVYK